MTDRERCVITRVGTVELIDNGGYRIEGWGFDCEGKNIPAIDISDDAVSGGMIAGYTAEELRAIAEAGEE